MCTTSYNSRWRFIPLGVVFLCLAHAHVSAAAPVYCAVEHTILPPKTWGLVHRDGANRPTEPYLGSLLNGESRTGTISSPPFRLTVDSVRFTIRGHDGQGGGRDQNFAALIDNKTGTILRKTDAPGHDALQQRAWDVADLQGRTVRFQLVDGNADGAYAWFGVEQIEAGPDLTIDFRKGIPDGWKTADDEPDAGKRRALVVTDGPVPFRMGLDAYTWIPEHGVGQVPVSCRVERVYLLGCTVPACRVLETYGYVDLIYKDGTQQTFPLMYGFTLESPFKTATPCDAACVRPIGDGTRYVVAIEPKAIELERIELRRAAADRPCPRISAITCQLDAATAIPGHLEPLDAVEADAADMAWLADHTLSAEHALDADPPTWIGLTNAIRSARGVPVTLQEVQDLEASGGVQFTRRKIADRPFEAASACDVDGDGKKDIVSGDYWYAGPDFTAAFRFRSLAAVSGYHDSFHDYPMDVNGDGRVDMISGGWFGKSLVWRENPGDPRTAKEWTRHVIDEPGPIETSRFWDIDGDGHVEIVPNAGGNVVFYRLARDAQGRGTGTFTKHAVKMGGCGHGLGYGDINGDGRGDFVVPNGWLEGPEKPCEEEWKVHGGFDLPHASIPILVHDVNEDGLADLIYGNGHGYGLFWVEQQIDGEGNRTWIQHTIDDRSAQYHDMMLADIDGDRRVELVTGKRYYAHNGNDPGAEDPVFVRYFDFDKQGIFTPHTLDYGPASQASGVGIYFWLEDMTGNQRLDIIAPGKEGLYLFLNEG